ncbi:hypothetical protein ACIQUW_06475 [Streptomyces sp. NPDC101117]|uniref:hypothetical protein n=1 Tax=Streptomyces sp. NPDC101117 TaxID=3366108 RepID=UPI0037F1590C
MGKSRAYPVFRATDAMEAWTQALRLNDLLEVRDDEVTLMADLSLRSILVVPWAGSTVDEPIIGDLRVDPCGMVLGDALALASWTGHGHPSMTALPTWSIGEGMPRRLIVSSAET